METTYNAESHLKTHSEDERVAKFFIDKHQKVKSKGLFDAQGLLVKSKLKETVDKHTTETRHDLQANIFIFNHIPHSITQTPEFIATMRSFEPGFKPIARDTFMEALDNKFKKMIYGI